MSDVFFAERMCHSCFRLLNYLTGYRSNLNNFIFCKDCITKNKTIDPKIKFTDLSNSDSLYLQNDHQKNPDFFYDQLLKIIVPKNKIIIRESSFITINSLSTNQRLILRFREECKPFVENSIKIDAFCRIMKFNIQESVENFNRLIIKIHSLKFLEDLGSLKRTLKKLISEFLKYSVADFYYKNELFDEELIEENELLIYYKPLEAFNRSLIKVLNEDNRKLAKLKLDIFIKEFRSTEKKFSELDYLFNWTQVEGIDSNFNTIWDNKSKPKISKRQSFRNMINSKVNKNIKCINKMPLDPRLVQSNDTLFLSSFNNFSSMYPLKHFPVITYFNEIQRIISLSNGRFNLTSKFYNLWKVECNKHINIGPTFVLFQNSKFRVGAYTDQNWTNSLDYKHSRTTFLFSLNFKRMYRIKKTHYDYSIRSNSQFGVNRLTEKYKYGVQEIDFDYTDSSLRNNEKLFSFEVNDFQEKDNYILGERTDPIVMRQFLN